MLLCQNWTYQRTRYIYKNSLLVRTRGANLNCDLPIKLQLVRSKSLYVLPIINYVASWLNWGLQTMSFFLSLKFNCLIPAMQTCQLNKGAMQFTCLIPAMQTCQLNIGAMQCKVPSWMLCSLSTCDVVKHILLIQVFKTMTLVLWTNRYVMLFTAAFIHSSIKCAINLCAL